MFIKLDQSVIDLLCCPLCKVGVVQEKEYFTCASCATYYPLREVNVGDHVEQVYDFRIQRPFSCIPEPSKLWNEGQKDFELLVKKESIQDRLESYLAEIEGVNEIYTEEFHISGSVLDVGGSQGRLRYYIPSQEVQLYVSINPSLMVFENIQHQPNLLNAYPCLSQPCNYLVAKAEELPFISNSFDWVHMRSVVDHFEDPFKALKEAYRVLRPNGKILIVLTIMENISHTPTARIKLKLEREGMIGLLDSLIERV
jgi:SAM-dependent methyltransferase